MYIESECGKMDKTAVVLMIALAILCILVIGLVVGLLTTSHPGNPGNRETKTKSVTQSQSMDMQTRWMVCRVKFYTDTISFSRYKNITLYVAWTDKLMSEGYRYKDSYDFLNKSAVGILFFFKDKTYPITISMKDVRLPITAVFYTTYIPLREPVEEKTNVKKIMLSKYYEKDLEPGKEYVINDPIIIAMIEFDPNAYFDLTTECAYLSTIAKIKSCWTAYDHIIEIDPNNCYLT